ncbi:MAG TPA: [LysW]-aminoadipate kinase [Actinophytocola sp.]|nr:[LysW]-aminoadipate kinase [Actinophytocola sp.]
MVKVGGALDADMSRVCADVRALADRGAEVVVVHGGGAAADRLGGELGRRTRYLTGAGERRSRYTDAGALDTLTLAMLGRVKPPLVTALLGLGVRAVGLSGIDGGLVTATRNPPARAVLDGTPCVVRDDLSGRITAVDPHLPLTLLTAGYVPVVSPPALDPAAGPLNVDADRFAAAIAVAMGADWLVMLSDVPGLLADREAPASLVPVLPRNELPRFLTMAGGRMKVKLRAAAEAHAAGVPNVVLADGRHDSPVLAAVAGAGTRLVPGVRDVRAS